MGTGSRPRVTTTLLQFAQFGSHPEWHKAQKRFSNAAARGAKYPPSDEPKHADP